MLTQLKPHLGIQVGVLQYSFKHEQVTFHANGFYGSGTFETYQESARYRGVELGVRTGHQTDKLHVEAEIMAYPQLERRGSTYQKYLGPEFNNTFRYNGYKTRGGSVSGLLAYDLAKHLAASFRYSVQTMNSVSGDDDGFSERLTLRRAAAGLQLRF